MRLTFDKWDWVFMAIAIAELCCVIWYQDGRFITKPLVMIALIGYYATKSPIQSLWFVIALVFAWLGDVFLMFDGFFLWGLGSFLLMQVIYAVIFSKHRQHTSREQWLTAFAIMFIFAGSIYFMIQQEINMLIPVAVYSAVISAMVVAGILRRKNGSHYTWITAGVLSFLISDAALGFNKFVSDFEGSGFVVMSTYILAQYCIVRGMILYELQSASTSNNP